MANHRADGKSSLMAAISMYKYRCKKKDRVWALSDDQAMTMLLSNCSYCGAAPFSGRRPSAERFNGNQHHGGIDRIDSAKGYTPENSVPCCKYCNIMKSALSYDEFMQQIIKIIRHVNAQEK